MKHTVKSLILGLVALGCVLAPRQAYGFDPNNSGHQVRFFASWAAHSAMMDFFEGRAKWSKKWAWVASTVITAAASASHDYFVTNTHLNGLQRFDEGNQLSVLGGVLTSTLFKVTLKW